jgi:hypothetical protein
MVTFRDAGPNDPMYREGPRSYSPHWSRAFRPKDALLDDTAEPQTLANREDHRRSWRDQHIGHLHGHGDASRLVHFRERDPSADLDHHGQEPAGIRA